MAHTVDKIIKNKDGSLGGIKRKKKLASSLGKIDLPEEVKKKIYKRKLMKKAGTTEYSKGGRAGYKHGGAAGCAIKGVSPILKK